MSTTVAYGFIVLALAVLFWPLAWDLIELLAEAGREEHRNSEPPDYASMWPHQCPIAERRIFMARNISCCWCNAKEEK
jgi:hypothetical protein